jgi:hypothetical protein
MHVGDDRALELDTFDPSERVADAEMAMTLSHGFSCP